MSLRGVSRPRRTIRRATLTALLACLLATAATAWGVAALQSGQERRLLETRAAETSLVLTQAANAIPERLRAQGAVLRVSGLSTAAYEQVASADPGNGRVGSAYAWLAPTGSGEFRVLATSGTGFTTGQVIGGSRAEAMSRALRTDKVSPSSLSGPERLLGFALGPPAAPDGTVLYFQSALGPTTSAPSGQNGGDPFAELDVVLYGTGTEDASQLLVATTRALPLRGAVRHQVLQVGDAQWLLDVKAQQPLVGPLAAAAPWMAAVTGLIGSLLVATIVETVGRRRDVAFALYASQRASAELLQRSLLPHLPQLEGLDIGARYLAGSTDQQVGGDWFDVFPVRGGGVGVVIGDVIGHDLAAAGAMAQVRSALRAYAVDGACPADVLDRLDRLVTTFEIAELVTATYGVLAPAAADGSRIWTWSNAGHLPTLLRLPDGATAPIHGGESLLLGTPMTVVREQADCVLPAGSTLLLFTDGLVEVPGGSIDEAVAALCASVQSEPAGTCADDVCARMTSTRAQGPRRDDVAVLAVRLV
ncbi:MAG: putative sensor protein [Frankiales bacterium]|nr:putative sensor protein [Frankiales bacterium]